MAASNDSRVRQALDYLAISAKDEADYNKAAARSTKLTKTGGSSSSSSSSSSAPKGEHTTAKQRSARVAAQPKLADQLNDWVKGVFGAPAAKLAKTAGDITGTNGLVNAVGQPMDVAEHPQNAAQQIMNVLSTGTYMTGEAQAERVHLLNQAKKNHDTVGAAIAGANLDPRQLGGAARGLAEGFGARFDNKKPKTVGQSLEDLGTKKVAEQALGKQHGDFAQGLLGGTADIAGDPMTFLTGGFGAGTGATRGVAEGVKGAAAAARDASGVSKIGAVLKGGAQGFAEGSKSKRLEESIRITGKAAAKAGRKADDKITKGMTVAEKALYRKMQADAVPEIASFGGGRAAADAAEPEAAAPAAARSEDFTPTDPKVAIAKEETPAAAALPSFDTPKAVVDPRVEAANSLLPQIVGSTGKTINAAEIARESTAPASELFSTAKTSVKNAKTITDVVKIPHTKQEWVSTERALRANPDIAKVLDTPMKAGDQATTVGDVARRFATGELTGDVEHQAFNQALRTGGNAEVVHPGVLGDMLDEGGFGKVFDTPRIAADLTKLPLGPRKTAIRNLLAPATKTRYPSFDAALRAGHEDALPASMMRTILNRLGIDSKAASPRELRELMGGQAKTDWEAIKATVRTPQEVLDIHGVDDAARAEADALPDGDTIVATASAHADAVIHRNHGFDPTKIDPRTMDAAGDSVASGLYGMARKFGDILTRGIQGKERAVAQTVEAYDNDMLREVFKAGVLQLTKHATIARLSGADRAAALVGNFRTMMREFDTYALGKGMMPRIVDKDTTNNPLYVSFSQIADSMSDEAVGRAFFSPELGRGTKTLEQRRQFSAGYTLYPNVIADGIRQALKGDTPEQVATFIVQKMLSFSKGQIRRTFPGFDEAVGTVTRDITRPEFLQKMQQFNAAQEPIALRLSQDAADKVMQPITERVMSIVNDGASLSRSVVLKQVEAAQKEAERAARNVAGYNSIASDIVRQRMDNGFVNGVLGQDSAFLLNMDARMKAAVRVEGAANGGIRRTQKLTPVEERGAQTSVRIANLKDNQPRLDENTPVRDFTSDPDGAVEDLQTQWEQTYELNGIGPMTQRLATAADREEDLADIASHSELFSGGSKAERVGRRIAVATEGTAGMGQFMKALAVSGQTFSYLVNAAYYQSMKRFAFGGAVRAFGPKTIGADVKIGEALGLGRKATTDEVKAASNRWWKALAAVPQGTTDEDARFLLTRTVKRDVAAGRMEAVGGLEPGEVDLAMEFKKFVDQVFDEGDNGLFVRSGIDRPALMESLRRYPEFRDGGAYASALPTDGSLAMSASMWRDIGDEIDDKFDLLDRYFSAMSAASRKPSMGAAVSHHFGIYNPSKEEIAARGLRRFNTLNEKGDLQRYIDPNAYFTPKDTEQLGYLQNLLNATSSFGPSMRSTVRVYDALTHVLKSSATIWRPGHHVTNLLGDMGANLMAGVNPLQYVRAIKMMHAGNMLADADVSTLAELNRLMPDQAGDVLDPKYLSETVRVNINGHIEELPLARLFSEGQNRGGLMTHSSARDVSGNFHDNVDPTTGQRLRNLTGLPQGDVALGQVSAIRDNLTRGAQLVHELENGQFKSMEDALERATMKVQEYHPTALNISAAEAKYARRAFYFYTWTRQMAGLIIRTALDRPALVTMPSKFQFEMAQANGLNPESIGQPIDSDNENVASYNATSLLGPTYFGGLAPTDTGDNSWGFSLSAPQIDTLQSLFVGANTVPGDRALAQPGNQLGGGLEQAVLGNLNPLLTDMPSLISGHDITDPQFREIPDRGKFLFDQSGAPAAVSKSAGIYNSLFPGSSAVKYSTPEEKAGDQQRSWINLLTGGKFTNYDGPASAAVAKNERRTNATKFNYQK